MKQLSNLVKHIVVFFIGLLPATMTIAQDFSSDINSEFQTTIIDKGPFYAQLWFWVVVGIVFLLLLIALIRGGGSRKREVKKTEKKEEQKE